MKQILLSFLILFASCGAASADCYADYKAKQDGPLRLHYGVARIDEPCNKRSAQVQLKPRLADGGWTLLTIVGTFGDGQLDSKEESAGEFFLRY